MRPCEEGKPCKHEVFDWSHDMMVCNIDFDGDACPYVRPWGKKRYEQEHNGESQKEPADIPDDVF